jgi:hypothetical protein
VLGFYQPPVDPVTAGRAASDDVVHLEIEHIPFKGDAEEGAATGAVSCKIVDHPLRVTHSRLCSSTRASTKAAEGQRKLDAARPIRHNPDSWKVHAVMGKLFLVH